MIAVNGGSDKVREVEGVAQEVMRDNNNEKQRSYTGRVAENSVFLPKVPESNFSRQVFQTV